MASKYQLQQEIEEYEVLKSHLSKTADNLDTASQNASLIKPELLRNHTIDNNSSVIGERSENLKKDISETSNYVRNVILPAIDSKVQSNRNEIARIEEEERRAREEAERRAREAEEKAKQEAEAKKNASTSTANRRISGMTFRW